MARGFADALVEELDFRVEARNIAAVVSASPAIKVHSVYPHLSTSRVLVIERLDGVNARDAAPLLGRSGTDQRALARSLLDCLLRQVMIGGTGLRRLLLAVARRNPSELHVALLDLAQVRADAGNDALERTLAQFMAQHLGPGC